MRMLRALLGWWFSPVREELEDMRRQLDNLEWRVNCVEAKAVQRRFREHPHDLHLVEGMGPRLVDS